MIDRSAVIKRLRRVEGQIKGIQKMVEEEKFCGDILMQVAAARAALNGAGTLILENYMKICLQEYIDGSSDASDLEKLAEIMSKYVKHS